MPTLRIMYKVHLYMSVLKKLSKKKLKNVYLIKIILIVNISDCNIIIGL